jgi:ankyrin repeat protein
MTPFSPSGKTELFNLIRSCRNALGKEQEVLDYFATHAVDVNGRHGFVEGTPLYWAVDAESVPLVHAILDQKGCDASIKTNTGESPLDLARRKNLTSCEQCIQKHNGKSFLMSLRMDNDQRALQLIRDREVGLDLPVGFVNAPPLYWAVDLNKPQLVKELLAMGANLTITSSTDETPLARGEFSEQCVVHCVCV